MAGPTIREAAAWLRRGIRCCPGWWTGSGFLRGRRPVPATHRFADLAETIVYQQLAGKAAASIHGRFVEALHGSVTPEAVLAASPEVLTGSGLSRAKAASIRDLATRLEVGRGLRSGRIGRLSDESGGRAPHPGAGHRSVDGPDVPHRRPWAPGRVAGGGLWACGPDSAGRGDWRRSRRRRRWSRWASRSVPTGPWWPGTAGGWWTTGLVSERVVGDAPLPAG